MTITAFFRDVIGAPLVNSRWSWGSHDRLTDSVFLRVWRDQIIFEADSQSEWVQIFWSRPKSQKQGFKERMHHLELLKAGTSGYGIECVAQDTEAEGAREIAKFDDSTLLVLGEVMSKDDGEYARVTSRIPVGSLSVMRDVEFLSAEVRNSETTKAALINARLGQGKFREAVLTTWGNRCCVTGSRTSEILRASHIKPWRQSTSQERLDPMNGLPLSATLDALFDVGLISFDDQGNIQISPRLSQEEKEIHGLVQLRLRTTPTEATRRYLKHHRNKIFKI
jgi:hypothetical protein